jgi:mycothiol synthase
VSRTRATSAIDVVEASRADAGAIAELVNGLARRDYGEAAVTESEVASWFDLPNLRFWIAKDPDGRLVAYGDVEEADERRRYWLDLRGDPERREPRGAVALLETVEAWARSRRAPDAVLRGIRDGRDDDLRTAYESAGFGFVRHTLEMRISLDAELPRPEWPGGIRVRTFVSPDDERRVHETVEEAFEDHWEFTREAFEEWRPWAIERPRFDPSLWFLAETEDGELAGCCCSAVHASGDPTFGYIETLGVRRRWRKQGLGLALLRHAFREFRARGMTRAALDVDAENLTGAVRLYERAGMTITKQQDIYERVL